MYSPYCLTQYYPTHLLNNALVASSWTDPLCWKVSRPRFQSSPRLNFPLSLAAPLSWKLRCFCAYLMWLYVSMRECFTFGRLTSTLTVFSLY
ncbi:hypothetical protein CHARACLAT_013293 [Characodon lateralis]|uniref:Uncharacterized protein n=1 Tax=Characodon lateralis TaxID=208331 RepID=A0ABU7E080_9TELE|nr:hypothetical protein [Characodon lateralis]